MAHTRVTHTLATLIHTQTQCVGVCVRVCSVDADGGTRAVWMHTLEQSSSLSCSLSSQIPSAFPEG